MFWKITCYNGTVWEATIQMDIAVALHRFYKETELSQYDIKSIENLH